MQSSERMKPTFQQTPNIPLRSSHWPKPPIAQVSSYTNRWVCVLCLKGSFNFRNFHVLATKVCFFHICNQKLSTTSRKTVTTNSTFKIWKSKIDLPHKNSKNNDIHKRGLTSGEWVVSFSITISVKKYNFSLKKMKQFASPRMIPKVLQEFFIKTDEQI